MIQAGKRKKEVADPYTVTGAVTKGNIITKLSLLIMGLGNIAHRQIANGESRKKSGMKRKVSMSTLPVISHP